jgi:hypothetical protein
MTSARPREVQGSRLEARILILLSVGLLVTVPCLIYGFPFYGDDSISNAILYRQFATQFWSGDIYPRWLQDLNGGLGNPTAYYYAPLSYWLTSLLKPFFRADLYGWRQLGASASIAVVASGPSVYYWLRKSVDGRSALVASLVYLVLPYHVNIDLYARGALAELWTFVWMPLTLLAVEGVIERRRFATIGLALSYGCLVLTHLPTTLIFSLIPLTYSFYLAPAGERSRSFVMTLAGMSLGAGLSAIYLLPALTMQEFIFHTTQGVMGHYYFGNWFLFTVVKWSGKYSEYFVASVGVIVLAGLAFAISRSSETNSLKKRRVFWFAVALCCLFMMTPLSKPVWMLLPTLQKVQFPFRFNTALSVAVTPLIAFACFKTPRRTQVLFLSVLLLFTIGYVYTTTRRAYYSYPAHHWDQSVVEAANKRFQQWRDTNEFRPRWVVSIEEDELDGLLRRIGQFEGQLKKVNVVQGEASVAVDKWTPREIVLRVDATAGATLKVSRFYFPGWMVRLDNSQTARAVEPSKPDGLISLDIPSGNHRVTLQLARRQPEVAGQIISGTCSLTLLVLTVVIWKSR